MNDKQGLSSWVTYYKICVADTWLCQVDRCQREMEKEKERNHLCLQHKSTSAPTNIRPAEKLEIAWRPSLFLPPL